MLRKGGGEGGRMERGEGGRERGRGGWLGRGKGRGNGTGQELEWERVVGYERGGI